MKVGILGGGQLGAMLSDAGRSLGIETAAYDPVSDCCAGTSVRHFCYSYTDFENLKKFAEWADIITYEFENVPLETVHFLSKFKDVHPSLQSLKFTQDRLKEKRLLNSLNIETAAYSEVNSEADIFAAADILGYPFFLKTRSGGYDGKGQWHIYKEEDIKRFYPQLRGKELIAEEAISFDREVSIVAVRDSQGKFLYYDLCENRHSNGILHHTRNVSEDLFQVEAEMKVRRLMDHLDYCGVLTLEFFQSKGRLLANEYAPRVHNSGHWTIEGTETSQFENHLRAVCGFPLKSVKSKGSFLMYNLIGSVPEELKSVKIENSTLHDYRKKSKPGRKAGHFTLKFNSAGEYTGKVKMLNKLAGKG